MNYADEFNNLRSRYHLEEILLYLHLHPNDFPQVFEQALQADGKKSWRVLWAVEKVSRRTPEWFDARMRDRLIEMVLSTSHIGMLRIGLSILCELPVPEPLSGELLNRLYDWMLTSRFSVGVQSISMKLLYKYVLTHPDLLHEYILVLEETDDSESTGAFISSRRNILKNHKKLVKNMRVNEIGPWSADC